MTEINALDLRTFVTNAVNDVFDTMLSMELQTDESQGQELSEDTDHIVGSVGFAGLVMGNVNVFVGNDFARRMTAAMLVMEEDEIESDEEVHDVVGELCNMIGGDLKSKLCDAGMECSLSIPSITSGTSFKIESKGWDRNETFGFSNNGHTALVEVYMKLAN